MILARHAEALFWAGRQLERSEHTVRLLDVASRAAMHHNPEGESALWEQVLHALGLATMADAPSAPFDHDAIDDYLFYSADGAGSIRATVGQLRDNVRAVRDRVPVELWEEVNRMWYLVPAAAVVSAEDASAERYTDVRRSCQAVTGVIEESMHRDDGWRFLQIGRMVERAVGIVRLVHHGCYGRHAIDSSTLLRMASSLQAFRRAHGYRDDPLAIGLFLLTEPDLPRSLLTCLRRAERHVHILSRATPGLSTAHRMLGRLRSAAEFDPLDIALTDDPGDYLVELVVDLASLAETVAVHAFDPARATVMGTQFVRPGTGADPFAGGGR